MFTILLIVLILLLIGLVPAYPYSRDWGWWPGSIVGVLLVVFVILLLTRTISLT